ncbi:hypothetical protein BSKO_01123 [Bryopsis sp. KO-2023]|nr:hypothetical protein BSKO_01123 [Bryopsis sp. KO-2023]
MCDEQATATTLDPWSRETRSMAKCKLATDDPTLETSPANADAVQQSQEPSPKGEEMVFTRERVVEFAEKMRASTSEGIGGLRELLSVDDLLAILHKACVVLGGEPTLVEVNVEAPDTTVTVVGDTHGQFHDVFKIFEMSGWPSEKNHFIFNGDFVDRGAWGLETLLMLSSWKICCPKFVHLVRGNHESSLCTRHYGFLGEVRAKYTKDYQKVYSVCRKVFSSLPLAMVVEGKTLVLHGGLFRKPPQKRSRKRGAGFLRPPQRRQAPLVLGNLEDLRQASKGGINPSGLGPTTVAGDVLWSDPIASEGMSLNDSRGVGIVFGPDTTEQFLQENNLKLVIRSHEGPDARDQRGDMPGMLTGYSMDHSVKSGKLMTVFSAPDYPQYQDGTSRFNNEGAVLILSGPDFSNPEIQRFTAAPRPIMKEGPFYDTSMFADSDVDLGLGDSVDNGSDVSSVRDGSDLETCGSMGDDGSVDSRGGSEGVGSEPDGGEGSDGGKETRSEEVLESNGAVKRAKVMESDNGVVEGSSREM